MWKTIERVISTFAFLHIWLNALMHRASNSTAPQLQLFLMPPQGELWAEERERKEAIDRREGTGGDRRRSVGRSSKQNNGTLTRNDGAFDVETGEKMRIEK